MNRNQLIFVLWLQFAVPIPNQDFFISTAFAAEGKCQIKGKVIDIVSGVPIEAATIYLFQPGDTIPASYGFSDRNGKFIFKNLLPGDYHLKVTYLGFRDFQTETTTLSMNRNTLNFGVIPLSAEARNLGEVTILANAGNTFRKLEKRTIYVEDQLSAAGGTASDLIRKLPSITQSPDGTISIHGNNHLLVFINGKPSALKGAELLQNTSAAEIKKIEIITSPSAKYEASGSGGIINLITKKKSLDGLNGNVQVSGDHLGGYSSDLLLDYKSSKFNFYTGIDHNKRKNQGDVEQSLKFPNDESSSFSKNGTQEAQRINTGIRSGFDYIPSRSNKIMVNGNYGIFETTNKGNWESAYNYIPSSNFDKNSLTDYNYRTGHYRGADITLLHNFLQENHTLSLSALWNNLNYDDQFVNSIVDSENYEAVHQATYLTKDNTEYRFNLDWVNPVSEKSTIEAGYQFSRDEEKESYVSTLTQRATAVTTGQANNFTGTIQGFYGTYDWKNEHIELKAGFRAENINRELKNSNTLYPLKRWDLYPSFNTSFRIDSLQEIHLNLTRRTDQLKSIQLDPLPRWYDFYNVRMGNPNLKNEIIDKLALEYQRNWKNMTLAAELFYVSSTGKIEVVRSVYQAEIIRNRFENIGNERTLGLEINSNWQLGKAFKLNEKLDMISSNMDVHLESKDEKRDYKQWYSVTTASLSLNPSTMLEADFTYIGPALTAQSSIDQIYMAGITFRKTFLHNKLSFTFSSRDVLGTFKQVEHIQGDNFNQTITTINKLPFRFSLSYKFNKYRRDERKVAKSPASE